jgi:DNA-binding CsgD family transcriptional regulator
VASGTVGVLGELVDASLLQADAHDGEDQRRFRMLETSREYALDQLSVDALDRARDRHLEYFVSLAEAGEEGSSGLGRKEVDWVQRITLERHNLLAAMAWARGNGLVDDLLRLLDACGMRFWYVAGGLTTGLRWIDQATSADVGSPARLGAVLAHGAWMAAELGDVDRGRSLFEQSHAAYLRAGDPAGQAEATMGLGYMALDEGDLDRAGDQFGAGLAVARELGDQRKVTEFLVGQGLTALTGDLLATAREQFEAALRAATASDDWWAIAWAQLYLGYLELVEGSTDAARGWLVDCRRRAQAVGEPWVAVTAMALLGSTDAVSGDLVEGRDVLLEAADIASGLGWWSNSVATVWMAGAVAEWLAAAGLLQQAVTLWAAAREPTQHQFLEIPVHGAAERLEERPRRLLPTATYEAARRAGQATPLADALEAALAAVRIMDVVPRIDAAARVDRYGLSARELEVLAQVANGRSDGEIADALFISKKTASVHVAHIKDKLGVESRVEAALIGARLGLAGGLGDDPGRTLRG